MKLPEFKTIAIGFIASIFAIQIISLLLSSVFPSISLIHGGTPILIMLAGIGVVTLFIVGSNVEKLKNKENLLFVVIVFGLIALAFWKGPTYFPQIFSIDPSISNSIKSTIGSIFQIGG